MYNWTTLLYIWICHIVNKLYPSRKLKIKKKKHIIYHSKITADGDCSHDIKRYLLLGRKAMTNLDSVLKSRDITLPTKVCIVKAVVFPIVICGCEKERKSLSQVWLFATLLHPWDFPGKSTGVGCHFLLQWMWELDHKEGWAPKNWCFSNYGTGEDSWESLGQQGDQTSQS